MEHADPKTFERIDPYYSKDNIYVFYGEKIIKDADPSSFKLVNKHGYSKDKNNAYYKGEGIKNADIESFKAIDYWRAKDKYRIYYEGKPLNKPK